MPAARKTSSIRRPAFSRWPTPARWAALAIVLIAASFGLRDSLGRLLAEGNPEVGKLIAPWNGLLLAEAAQTRFALEPGSTDRSAAAGLARAALRREPASVKAATIIGLQAQLGGDIDASRRAFGYALRLSRRDFRTQLWAIEEAVNAGDIVRTLAFYDMALRTSARASEMLFPTLSAALAEPKVRAALREHMRARAPWTDAFIDHAGVYGSNPAASAIFFRQAEADGIKIDDADRTAVVNALVDRGDLSGAWSYYVSFRPDASRLTLRDPTFSRVTTTPAAFDWTLLNALGRSVSIQRSDGKDALEYSVPAGSGGPVVEQTMLLPAGAYRLHGRSSALDDREPSRSYWRMTCPGGREIGRVSIAGSGENVPFAGMIVVPADCSVQVLSLIAWPSQGIAGVSRRVHSVAITPSTTTSKDPLT